MLFLTNQSSSIFVLIIILLIIFFGLYLYENYSDNSDGTPQKLDEINLKINNNDFVVQVANSSKTLQKGLMYRESVGDKEGMLFIFPTSSIYPFWMKNTLIPLDIIWLNSEKQIIYIYKDAKPCNSMIEVVCNSIIPPKAAKYVLEINSGISNKLGIAVGDTAIFDENSIN